MMPGRTIGRVLAARSFRAAQKGTSGVEFALSVPLMLLLLFGGYAICEAVSISRKVTITTRALADLTTQYTGLTTAQMTTIQNASAEIIAPFNAAPLSLRISEITVLPNGLNGLVVWSSAMNATPYKCATTIVLPAGMNIPSTSYILSEVGYAYAPPVGGNLTGNFNLGDKIFMLPRMSSTVAYPSGC